ncbi:MAG: hypothetical protein Q4F95_09370 [Oscillospiraceae bacterium]|nr:hypothetical protein [Oscillospiraceae bacterium]
MNKKEVTSYLEKRYDKTFTYVSSEHISRSQRNYLDKRIKKLTETASDSDVDDIVDTYKDENNLEFHVYHFIVFGVSSYWEITDDYCVQYLISQSEIYAPLEQSSYNYTYYNTIGMGEERKAGFKLCVTNFNDIRQISELAFSIIGNDAAILPDCGTEGNEHYTMSITPEITLVTSNELELGTVKFRTEYCPQITDKDNFIRRAENQFIEYVKDGQLVTDIFPEVLSRNDLLNIPVYMGEKQIATLSNRYNKYCIEDQIQIGTSMNLNQLRSLCELAGYTMTETGSKVKIEKESNTIVIERFYGKNYDTSNFTIFKNGKKFIPEGKIDDNSQQDICWLTISDYYYLFGIHITVDYENSTASISLNESD